VDDSPIHVHDICEDTAPARAVGCLHLGSNLDQALAYLESALNYHSISPEDLFHTSSLSLILKCVEADSGSIVRRGLVIALHLARVEERSDSPFLDGAFCVRLGLLLKVHGTLGTLALQLTRALLCNRAVQVGFFERLRESGFVAQFIAGGIFGSNDLKMIKWGFRVLRALLKLCEVGVMREFSELAAVTVHFVGFSSDIQVLPDMNPKRAEEKERKIRRQDARVRCAAAGALAILLRDGVSREIAHECEILPTLVRSLHRHESEDMVRYVFECIQAIVETDGVSSFLIAEPFLMLIRSSLQDFSGSSKVICRILDATAAMLPGSRNALWEADVVAEVFDIFRLGGQFGQKVSAASFLMQFLRGADEGQVCTLVSQGFIDAVAGEIDAFHLATQWNFLDMISHLGRSTSGIGESVAVNTGLRVLAGSETPEIAIAAEGLLCGLFAGENGGHAS
jgi:hypothetical protein